ncbi:YhhN-like [Aphelenchoides avenae]|nr:YhhN-like [Aphelenchus avenae]KAH7712013.1 YhhN-like [Aphelenchus avenae]
MHDSMSVECARTATVYGSLVALVFLATDGFQKNEPCSFTLPVAALGISVLFGQIPLGKRLASSSSFFMLSTSLYQWSERSAALERNALLLTIAHILYLFSFIRNVRRWWHELAAVTAAAMSAFWFYALYDMSRSMPTPVIAVSSMIFVVSTSFVAAGSAWKYEGPDEGHTQSAALARWVGSFLSLAFVWALLSNHFAVHTSKFAPLLNGTYFLSEFILYYANEKAFFRD